MCRKISTNNVNGIIVKRKKITLTINLTLLTVESVENIEGGRICNCKNILGSNITF